MTHHQQRKLTESECLRNDAETIGVPADTDSAGSLTCAAHGPFNRSRLAKRESDVCHVLFGGLRAGFDGVGEFQTPCEEISPDPSVHA